MNLKMLAINMVFGVLSWVAGWHVVIALISGGECYV